MEQVPSKPKITSLDDWATNYKVLCSCGKGTLQLLYCSDT
jgi:hypothetical protein